MSAPVTQQAPSSAALTATCAELNALHDSDRSSDRFSPQKWDVVRRGSLTRLPFATRWGGLEEDLPGTMRVFEALGWGCRDGGLRFSLCTHVVSAGVPLQRFGSPELQDRHLRSLCDGRVIGAHAISEPVAGSDALAMRTTAERRPGGYVLDGTKAFVTNGPVAGVFVVYARTSAQAGPFGHILAHARCRSSREGECRWISQSLASDAEPQVGRPEVMAPLGNAMGFIHAQERWASAFESRGGGP